jgi:hypothetical protein
VGPAGPLGPVIVTCNVEGWLVAVLSLASSNTDVAPVPPIAIPKLVPGEVSQLFTKEVTSTRI